MKKCLTIFLVLFVLFLNAQEKSTSSAELALTNFSALDSLEKRLGEQKEDSSKVLLLGTLAYSYAFREAEKGVYYGQQGLRLAEKINYEKGRAVCASGLGCSFWALGNYHAALQFSFDCLQRFERLNDKQYVAQTHTLLAIIYRDVGDYKRALPLAYKANELQEAAGFSSRIGYANIGSIYELQNRLDSASKYVHKAHELDLKHNAGKWDWIYYLLGNIAARRKHYDSALIYYRTALPLAIQSNIYKSIVEALNGIANVHREIGNIDSCIFYAKEVLQKWSTVSYQKGVLQTVDILAAAYKAKLQQDSTIKYLELSAALRNKLFSKEQERDIQNTAFNEQMRKDVIEREQQQYRNKLKMYSLLATGFILLIIAFMLWRNNQHRKKAYVQLQQQKVQTDRQKVKAEAALQELKATQAQLIQSEKMASLGELTAGIAHEIQNPLNFVNNFSEINAELIAEMKQELAAGNSREAITVADDIDENNLKIHQHGKRADTIVKGMLQHSRASTGKKEWTGINALADEYLRLSYHGLRGKDKDFNAELKTKFDENIGDIEVAPQDIGRVLLNLYNNAFYAVSEKKKQLNGMFEPTVEVTTKRVGDKVELSVKDNGTGIPQKLLDKIFQPFFTTKPTGQGTGLGLSLSYDIIRAHGGELKVETKEGEGAEFFILLPHPNQA
jgi:signal transduction histidine kinase